MALNEVPHCHISQADDDGRRKAYDHIIAMRKWPLSQPPKCPYTHEKLRDAWQKSFNDTVQKHRDTLPKAMPETREIQ